MIRYTLKCKHAHAFESWFASADAFDSLNAAGHVTCPECGGTEVTKTLMTPGVRPSRSKAAAPVMPPEAPAEAPVPTASTPAAPPAPSPEDMRAQLAEMKQKVEANSDYVGLKFASEARAMHEGDIPHRAIYGEAKLEDAKQLLQEGVPVAPLPFIPTRKTN